MLNDYGKELFKPWCSVQNIGVVLSVFFISTIAIKCFSLNSSEVASWVQAVGSIFAIWGAFQISHRQQKAQERKAEVESRERYKRLKSTYTKLAYNQHKYLSGLCKLLDNTLPGSDGSGIREYLSRGKGLRWGPHIEALKEFSIVDLEQIEIYSLIELKVGAEYARFTCEKLTAKGLSGIDFIPDIEQLEFHRDEAKVAYDLLGRAT